MRERDNRLVRWAVYNLAWWIVKRRLRGYRRQERRRVLVAVAVIGAALLGGFLLGRVSRPGPE